MEPYGGMRDKKMHAVVVRSTFPSQNAKNTTTPQHFWTLTRRKSARRCGAKHISKSKCTKHTSVGALLEVEMFKKCTPLWREAHSKSKCTKHTILGALFELRMWFAWQAPGNLAPCQSEQKVMVLWQFQKCRQAWDI